MPAVVVQRKCPINWSAIVSRLGTGDSVPRPLGFSASAPAAESALGSHPCVALSSAPPARQCSASGANRGTASEGVHTEGFLFAWSSAALHVQGANGSRPGIGGLLQQQTVVEIYPDASVGSMADLHRASREALLASQRGQLHFQARADSDDMIVADLAFVAQAEDPVQIQPPIELAIGRTSLPRHFRELPVVVVQEAGQYRIGLLKCGCFGQAQFTH